MEAQREKTTLPWQRPSHDLDSPTSLEGEGQPFLQSGDSERDDTETTSARRSRAPSRRPWIISTIVLALSTTVLATLQILSLTHPRTDVCVRQSDTFDARGAIEYEQRTWTGALTFDVDTQRAIRLKDGDVQFVGEPSKEIDAAWDDLLRNEFISMTDEEAAPFLPDLVKVPVYNQYLFEPEVTHSLHCLNALRKEVSKTLYPNASYSTPHSAEYALLPAGFAQPHMEHCIDRLRQSVMCQGDLTPSPLFGWPGKANIYIGRTKEHTCRRWEPIRNWIDERSRRGSGESVCDKGRNDTDAGFRCTTNLR